LRCARRSAALRAWSNEGFESNPPYPPNKQGRGTPWLGCRLGGGITRLLRRLAPAGRLRCARRSAALRAWSNEGFESNPPYPPNKQGPCWAPVYLAEREGFEPSIRY
ncbi:MAG: hypothetical protein AB2608_04610, partial [Candidatus Thiodiazotropha sp.]